MAYAMGDQLLENYAAVGYSCSSPNGTRTKTLVERLRPNSKMTVIHKPTKLDVGQQDLPDPFQVNDDFIDWSDTKGTWWSF